MDKLEIASIKIVKKMIEKEKRRKGRKQCPSILDPYPIYEEIIPRKEKFSYFHPKESRQLIADIFRMTHGYTMASPFDGYQFLLRASG
jgi:hypothetical protein